MRKLASIQIVNAAEPIPNADAIERIRVLGWWVVVKKGESGPRRQARVLRSTRFSRRSPSSSSPQQL
ncbi:MAG: hypothetical protein U0792_23640 [Gemmataceae bacterium]